MTIKVFIGTGSKRRLIDAELISENKRTVWVRVPFLTPTYGRSFVWSTKMIKRKRGRDL